MKEYFGRIGSVSFSGTVMTRNEAYYRHPKMLYQIKTIKENSPLYDVCPCKRHLKKCPKETEEYVNDISKASRRIA